MSSQASSPSQNTHPLDLHWLTPNLAVGGRIDRDAAPRLRALSLGAVVDVRCEDCDDESHLREYGIDFLNLPTQDSCALSIEDLWTGAAWIGERLDRGVGVLIHCQYGIGRSPLLAMCALVDRGYDPVDAMHLAKRARAVVSPSRDQLSAFVLFAEQSRERRREVRVPTLDELMAIAYSHMYSRGGTR